MLAKWLWGGTSTFTEKLRSKYCSCAQQWTYNGLTDGTGRIGQPKLGHQPITPGWSKNRNLSRCWRNIAITLTIQGFECTRLFSTANSCYPSASLEPPVWLSQQVLRFAHNERIFLAVGETNERISPAFLYCEHLVCVATGTKPRRALAVIVYDSSQSPTTRMEMEPLPKLASCKPGAD